MLFIIILLGVIILILLNIQNNTSKNKVKKNIDTARRLRKMSRNLKSKDESDKDV
ncbi:hypothetical protein SLT67_07410 [Paenibacillus illinoisensis]|uniref:hypothetical protein n=1 Tax=Paenibacillus illinoisensis TaxID=59845 RepID=UPI003CECED60